MRTKQYISIAHHASPAYAVANLNKSMPTLLCVAFAIRLFASVRLSPPLQIYPCSAFPLPTLPSLCLALLCFALHRLRFSVLSISVAIRCLPMLFISIAFHVKAFPLPTYRFRAFSYRCETVLSLCKSHLCSSQLFLCERCESVRILCIAVLCLAMPSPLRYLSTFCQSLPLLNYSIQRLSFAEQIKAVAILIISAHSRCKSFLTILCYAFSLQYPAVALLNNTKPLLTRLSHR